MAPSPAATSAPKEETRIGPYTLRVWSPVEEVPDRLKNGYYGTGLISSAHGEWIVDDATHLLPLPAADITGDGQPEAMFAVQTGGSHCCSGIALYSLSDAPKLLLRAMGGGGIGVVISGVRDLDGDGVYELLGRLFVSGPCTWPSVQLILQFDGQGYVQAGQRFASEYQAEITEFTRSAVAGRDQAVAGYKCSGVLELVLAYLYAGQTDMAWTEFYRLYPAPDADEFRRSIEQAVAASQFQPISCTTASPDWRTYTDDVRGYAFEYPARYEQEPMQGWGCGVHAEGPEDGIPRVIFGSENQLSVTTGREMTLEAYVEQFVQQLGADQYRRRDDERLRSHDPRGIVVETIIMHHNVICVFFQHGDTIFQFAARPSLACWDPARGITNPDMFWHAVDSFRLTR